MLRRLANREIQQLHDDRREHQPYQKALDFIPEPRAKFLRGELELSLQPETVVVKPKPQRFADQEQEEQIHKDGERVVLESPAQGKIAQPTSPARHQQNHHKSRADDKIRNPQPAVDPVVTARLRRIGSRG
jgi:hypothetical protein